MSVFERTRARDDDENDAKLADVSEEEYRWAFATVVSRAIRFGDRSDRSSWSSLFMEPVSGLWRCDGRHVGEGGSFGAEGLSFTNSHARSTSTPTHSHPCRSVTS